MSSSPHTALYVAPIQQIYFVFGLKFVYTCTILACKIYVASSPHTSPHDAFMQHLFSNYTFSIKTYIASSPHTSSRDTFIQRFFCRLDSTICILALFIQLFFTVSVFNKMIFLVHLHRFLTHYFENPYFNKQLFCGSLKQVFYSFSSSFLNFEVVNFNNCF